ncbi:antibiotic biosynthesis monooxygenase family protein [Streptomyces bungoensis]|uniref:putative quinol monooxygenase n=1 Tax=Streptomyces bungoensis TaxID=285568 RepID=UPI003415C807
MPEPTHPTWPLAGARPGEIVVIARWTPADGSREDIETALPELVRASSAEPGCLGYGVLRQDNGDIVLVERYADQEALRAHRESEHFQRIVQAYIVPRLVSRDVTVTGTC